MKIKNLVTTNLLLIALVMATPLFSQQWSNPILIASGDTPDIAIDPITGNIFIVSMNNGVMLTKVSPTGLILEQERVPGAEADRGAGHFGASVAVDMNGYPHVCYRLYKGKDPDGAPLYSAYYVKKTAAGWQNSISLSQNVRRGYVVRIDVDLNNVAHIVQGFIFDEEGSIHGRINYFRIINNSIDKQEELGMSTPYIYRGDDRIEITTSPTGNVYIISGVPDPNGRVYYLFSTDGGDHFTNWGDIHSNECPDRNGSPDLAVDSIGYLHICYGACVDGSLNSSPSVRYARFLGDSKKLDRAATPEGYVVDWKIGMGLGSIACNDDGQALIIAFSEQPGGKLYTTLSIDTGATWQIPIEIVATSGSDEGRNKHFIRSRGDTFYLVYPYNYNVYLRILTVQINKPPYAFAGGPYNAPEGSTLAFDASGSKDPDGTIVKYEWDWQNDGVYDTTTISAIYNHSFTDNFSGRVKVRVTDNEGLTDIDLEDLTITNVNPTANAGGPYQGLPNENIQCNGTATDPGTDDILIYNWDLDLDGIFEVVGQNINVKFSKGGIYKIVLQVSDDDGGVGLDTTTVKITSQPPVVSPIPSQTINEGIPFNTVRLDHYVIDPDNSDAEINWAVHGNKNLNVNFDTSRVATITPYDENWYGSETITFVASDPGQLKDSTSTTFTINNINDPPIILPMGNRTTNEGAKFDPINLDNFVIDSDNSVEQISWQVAGNVHLGYEIINRILTVAPLDHDWAGNEWLIIIASDLGGLSDSLKVLFTVIPVNDPPKVSSIAGQQQFLGDDFTPINLDDYVTDPDHRDDELTWSYRGNNNLLVSLTNRTATISRSNTNWIGSEMIVFIAADPLGAKDSTSVLFESIARNKPPVVSHIPDQQILEGQDFQPIYLDGYVTDPDHDDSRINWRISGNKNLIVTLANRVANIKPPDPDWNGKELITFKAIDPSGQADSSITVFTIFPVNDPPRFAEFPEFQIFEDDSLIWSFEYLCSRVTDPDNDSTDFRFLISDNMTLSYRANTQKRQIIMFGPPNWYGEETITVNVFDGVGGSDAKPCKITVRSVPDKPLPFAILLPSGQVFSAEGDSIHFSWRKAIDPEGGQPMYQLNIADDQSFHHVIDQFNNITDTTFTYVPKITLTDGIYYWKILAFNGVGFTSSDVGSFQISSTAVLDNNSGTIPTDYALMQNYPNPFNPETWIVYQLPKKSHVILEVYNALGQRVTILENEFKEAGTHNIKWNVMNASGQRLPSGIYICRLKAGDRLLDMKMVLLQ